MSTPALPAVLVVVLPVIVTAVAGVLSHDRAPQWLNAVIAFLVVGGAAIGGAALDNKLTPSLIEDIVVIAAYCAALMGSPMLQPLYQWLKVNTASPFAAIATPPARVTGQGVISSAGTVVIPRASALPPGKQFIPGPGVIPDNGTPPAPTSATPPPTNG